MTTAWFVYVLLTGSLVALAVVAIDAACRLAGWPRRWAPIGGLLMIVALAIIAPERSELQPVLQSGTSQLDYVTATATQIDIPATTSTSSASVPVSAGAIAEIAQQITTTIARVPEFVQSAIPRQFESWYTVVWIVISALLLVLFLQVHLRFLRARREWPRMNLQGTEVRLSEDAGPAVVGAFRPDIVIPKWLLQCTQQQQKLVLTHESEHVRARDPLVLASAWTCAVALPWHPAVWWMLWKLRLAVEMDCDARVLARGAAPGSYGELLIELSQQTSGLPVGATALADRTTHLERRLLAMNSKRSSHNRLRIASCGALAIVFAVTACAVRKPADIGGSAASPAPSPEPPAAVIAPPATVTAPPIQVNVTPVIVNTPPAAVTTPPVTTAPPVATPVPPGGVTPPPQPLSGLDLAFRNRYSLSLTYVRNRLRDSVIDTLRNKFSESQTNIYNALSNPGVRNEYSLSQTYRRGRDTLQHNNDQNSLLGQQQQQPPPPQQQGRRDTTRVPPPSQRPLIIIDGVIQMSNDSTIGKPVPTPGRPDSLSPPPQQSPLQRMGFRQPVIIIDGVIQMASDPTIGSQSAPPPVSRDSNARIPPPVPRDSAVRIPPPARPRVDTTAIAALGQKLMSPERSQSARVVVIVDGKIVCTGPCDLLTTLAVMEIESIDVVRGAAVIALYGENARDGAVSIRTKRGRS